jgi:hypothetical protein
MSPIIGTRKCTVLNPEIATGLLCMDLRGSSSSYHIPDTCRFVESIRTRLFKSNLVCFDIFCVPFVSWLLSPVSFRQKSALSVTQTLLVEDKRVA